MRLLALLCLAAATLPCAAQSAATTVQPYGLLSAGVVSGNGFTISDERFTAFGEQLHSSNRWGLRGSEDLGQGLQMKFMLESSLSVRSGAAGQDAGGTGVQGSGPLFDREAHLALSRPQWGSLRVGRSKNLLYELADSFDARGNWNFGALKPVARYAGFYGSSGISRFNNLLRYSSPELGGMRLDLAYTLGGVPGEPRAGSGYVLGVTIERSPFSAGYAHAELRVGDGQPDVNQRVDLLVAKTQIERVTVNIGYARTRNPTGGGFAPITSTATVAGRTSADTWFAGLRYQWTPAMSVHAGYYDVRDRATGGINDVWMIAAGIVHAFSPRTELIIDIAHAQRKAGATAAFTLYDRFRSDGSTPSESTRDQTALVIGVQHRF